MISAIRRSRPIGATSHYQLPTYVQDVWSLLDSHGVQRVLVVGTSLGALIGMMLAGVPGGYRCIPGPAWTRRAGGKKPGAPLPVNMEICARNSNGPTARGYGETPVFARACLFCDNCRR
jgi:hypothetical protein